MTSAIAFLSAMGCDAPDEVDATSCPLVVWAQPQRTGASVAVEGSWDDWRGRTTLQPYGRDGWLYAQLFVPPGSHSYLLVEEARRRLDPTQPLSTFRETDGKEVSLVQLGDCHAPQLEVEDVKVTPGGLQLELALDASPAHVVDAGSLVVHEREGQQVAVVRGEDGAVATLQLEALARGRHELVVEGRDDHGDEVRQEVAVWQDPVADRFEDGLVYQIMIDRFGSAEGTALMPPATPTERAGGHLQAVTRAIEGGYFEALGVATLWLSPVYTTPVEARYGRDDQPSTAYHGYWVADSRGVDPRIGGEQALHELVATAHAHGLRVLLDLVPNHVDETHPWVAEHGADGWFHQRDPLCICGAPDCGWNEFIKTCWFAPYLPDLRFEQPAVLEAVLADAKWWLQTFGVDGFRVDAVPMMPRLVTRRLVHELREAVGHRRSISMLGEIFTGAGGLDVIRYYLGPDGLDSAFDFPLMWAIRDVLATKAAGFQQVEDVLESTDAALEHSQSFPARMIGNHDVTRFSSVAHGEGDADAWKRPATQPQDERVYADMLVAHGLVLSLPGVPILYYGDEIGLAGGNDPDNRRVLPPDDALMPAQVRLRDGVARLGRARRCLPALHRGERHTVLVERERYGFVRDAGDGSPALVLVSLPSSSASSISVRSSRLPDGRYVDVLGGPDLHVAQGVAEAAVTGLAVYLPAQSPCAADASTDLPMALW